MTVTLNAPTLEVDLSDPELFRNGFPYAVFDPIRDEAPLWWHPPTEGVRQLRDSGFWVVARHADVQAVSRDTSTYSSLLGPALVDTLPQRRGASVVTADAPAHTRLRRLVSQGFTPRAMDRLETLMSGWASRILDSVAEQGSCDFVADVAHLLPLHVIADIVGIPVADRAEVFGHTTTMLRSSDPRSGIPLRGFIDAERALLAYARSLADAKRSMPDDDIWSALMAAEVTLDDGTVTHLSDVELDMWFLILSIAGSETTRNALAIGLMTLLRHPDQLERLRADPSLLPVAVDEILRWSSPVVHFRRTVAHDTELHGQRLAAGDAMTVWYPPANRDPTVFEDPYRFDIGRRPNPHVSFGGGGAHYCLGANLAKRELLVLFGQLLERMRDIEITGEVRWSVPGLRTPTGLGLDHLPISFTMS